MKTLIVLSGLAVLLAACETASEPGDLFAEMIAGMPAEKSDRIASRLSGKPLGSEDNPIRVYMPEGQRAYLARLRCADDRAPTFQRIGSMGIGPYDQIVDGYQVDCAGSTPASSVLHLDMYHPAHAETQAPPGFKIVP